MYLSSFPFVAASMLSSAMAMATSSVSSLTSVGSPLPASLEPKLEYAP